MRSIAKSPRKYVKYAKATRKLDASLEKMRKEPSRNFFLGSISSVFKFRDYDGFNEIYQQKMIEGELKDELIEFALFDCGIGSVNSFYFPAANGYQCGNHWASRQLYWEAFKIVVKNTLSQKYYRLRPKELWWTIRYRTKRRWKKLWGEAQQGDGTQK